MLGQMQDWPLRVGRIIDHAATYHGGRRIVGRGADGARVETDWAGIRHDAMRLTEALRGLGIRPGTVVGVMAWNAPRHLVAWYGVPGAGAVLHSLNPRLGAEQLGYICDHAEDAWILVDPDLVPVLEEIAPALPRLQGVIVLDAKVPETTLRVPVLAFDALIDAETGGGDWTAVEEGAACGICYTSGTTGNPKGVVYAHRSNVLHAMTVVQPDMFGLSCRDVVMPVVPLFHANGWSTGFSAPLAGAGMVLPGRQLDPASLMEMLGEGVTFTAAVPTVWLPLLAHLDATAGVLPDLERVVIGGSACPRAVIEAFQERYGVRVLHAWGMTECSPIGTVASFKPEVAAAGAEARMAAQLSVGHPPFGVELGLRDELGRRLPADGTATGRLQIRGPGVIARYLKADAPATDAEGWFDTGDAATLDGSGYVRITDRVKDVIKSGGEWISSIDLENAAVGHPEIAEAAAIAMPHPKWGERPVLVVVLREGGRIDAEGVLATLAPHFARWQLPDEVIFRPAIPHTATGKISKRKLRDELSAEAYRLPDLR